MIRTFFILGYIFMRTLLTQAQVVATIPLFVKESDSVTIIFDATLGNAALKNLGPPDVYAHSGVITSKSTSSTDWRYVQGKWGTADAKMKMQYLGANKYQMRFHIRSFYGVPVDEKINKMAFVFRNADGSKVGRNSDDSDIYVEVFKDGSHIRFTKPSDMDFLLVEKNKPIEIEITASDSGKITLFENSLAIDSANGTQLNYIDLSPSGGNKIFIAKLKTPTVEVTDTLFVLVNEDVAIETSPANIIDGINYIDSGTVVLSLFAPNKQFIYVIGDFNQWKATSNYALKKTPDGNRWWITLSGLTPGKTYAFQYWVDGKIRIADPYSTLVLDPDQDGYISSETFPNIHPYPIGKTKGIVGVMQPGKEIFRWQEFAFKKPDADKLNIYELHIRDFIAAHNYKTLKDTLPYLKKLGINAIQLMPVNEFEGNSSWGYNASFHMALDKYYGTEVDFKLFIQECHRLGMAVILDVVFNHAFSQNSLCQLYWDEVNFRPTADNPWLNPTAKHDFNVGYDFNHESKATQAYMDRILKYWLDEFKIDGFRFDLSKGFTQKTTIGNVSAWGNYDQSRIDLLKRMRQQIISDHPDAYLVLEHFADNDEEKVLAGEGFMLWGNLNHDFLEASMGFAANFNWLSYKNRGWVAPRIVGYMESHDEERMMYKTLNFGAVDGGYNIKQTPTALKRAALSSVLFFSVPGPKMIWQFGEIGYDYSINYNGRLGEKPIKWDYLNVQGRKDLFQVYAEMLYLRNNQSIFHTGNFEMNTGSAVKIVKLNEATNYALVIGNFNTKTQIATPVFQKFGMWYEYFSGDSIRITDVNMALNLPAGEYRIYTTEKMKRPGNLLPASVDRYNVHYSVYPNPGQNRLMVAMHDDRRIDHVVIKNISGQVIQSSWRNADSSLAEVELHENTPAGIYFIHVTTEGNVYTSKYVKQ